MAQNLTVTLWLWPQCPDKHLTHGAPAPWAQKNIEQLCPKKETNNKNPTIVWVQFCIEERFLTQGEIPCPSEAVLFTSISAKIFIKDSRTALYYAKNLHIKCCLYVFSIWIHYILNAQTLQIVVVKKDLDDFLKYVFDWKKPQPQGYIRPLDNFYMKDWTKLPPKVIPEE